jgi:hypothetical protein
MVYDKMTKGKSTIRRNGNKTKWKYGQVKRRWNGIDKRRNDKRRHDKMAKTEGEMAIRRSGQTPKHLQHFLSWD